MRKREKKAFFRDCWWKDTPLSCISFWIRLRRSQISFQRRLNQRIIMEKRWNNEINWIVLDFFTIPWRTWMMTDWCDRISGKSTVDVDVEMLFINTKAPVIIATVMIRDRLIETRSWWSARSGRIPIMILRNLRMGFKLCLSWTTVNSSCDAPASSSVVEDMLWGFESYEKLSFRYAHGTKLIKYCIQQYKL